MDGDRSHSHSATYEVTFPTECIAATVYRAIEPEVGSIEDDRSRTSLAHDGTTLSIRITSSDPVALRAATNTWLTWVDLAWELVAIETAPGADRPEGQ